jgi:hypothetical protein
MLIGSFRMRVLLVYLFATSAGSNVVASCVVAVASLIGVGCPQRQRISLATYLRLSGSVSVGFRFLCDNILVVTLG